MEFKFTQEEENELKYFIKAVYKDPNAFIYSRMNAERKMEFLQHILNDNVKIDLGAFGFSEEEFQFVYSNIDKFIPLTSDLFSLKESFSYDSKILDKINELMNSHMDSVMESIMNNLIIDGADYSKDTNIKEIIELVVQDIIKNEKCNLSDITIIGKGAYSIVLSIHDKVFKVGVGRDTKSFPNNPYIIRPLLRKNIKINDIDWFLEVTERVDTESYVSERDLYEIYKKLRQLGLIWTDVKRENVGRLLKDNNIHWERNLSPTEEALNLDGYRGDGIVLQTGDLVIIDADHIYDENDPNIYYGENAYSLKFEEMYQRELSASIKK